MLDVNTPGNRMKSNELTYRTQYYNSSLPRKILIIDDDRDLRLAMADILVNEGYKVVTAKNGEEALNYISSQSHLPNLVLLDLSMPVCDGREFLKQQDEMHLDQDIPVIVVSGFIGDQTFDAKQVKAYLEKPFNMHDLLSTIELTCR
jgi:CheY-like chemotaxis protein